MSSTSAHILTARIVRFLIKSFFCLSILMPNICFAEEKKIVKVVEVEKIVPKDITQSVGLIGTVQAKRSTVLFAKTIGTLDYVAHAGQKITKSDLIAKLENADLERTFILSESAAKNAKDQYDRILQLEKSRLAPKQDVEDRKNQWIEAQKALNGAKIQFDQTRFIAPFDGIVGGFKIREGVQVQVGDPIVSFYDPSELIVEFDIPTPILKLLHNKTGTKSGSDHKVIIDGKKITVPQVQKMIDPDTHMSPAYVDYACEDCVVGANIPVEFIIAKHESVIVIPHDALFLRKSKPYVYIVKDNKAILCAVTPGIGEKDKVEITSGLSVGDVVITRGQDRLWPDVEVKIFEPGTPAQDAASMAIAEKKSASS
jgi:membrane fusion protein (multidrug efflux system)